MFDELVMLRTREEQPDHATVATKDAGLDLPVAHEGSTVRTSFDANTGPAVKHVGDVIDERGRIGGTERTATVSTGLGRPPLTLSR
jgi:hypothetical protein